MLEQLKQASTLPPQQDVTQIPGVAQKDPSVSLQEDSATAKATVSPPKKVSPDARQSLGDQNKDLDDLYQEGTDNDAGYVPKLNLKKRIVRRAQEDGFFKTGVEVVEQEEYEFQGSTEDAAELFKQGQLTAAQIRELLQKKLKDDRIFGYENYDEFNNKYFKKVKVEAENLEHILMR